MKRRFDDRKVFFCYFVLLFLNFSLAEDEDLENSDGEEEGEQREGMKEMKEFIKLEKKRGKTDNDEQGGGASDEEVDDLVLQTRADGSKKIVNVFGEEDYKKKDIQDLEVEMGTKMEPFNLKEEMETGHFDEAGHYVERNFATDAWLEEMDETHQNVLGGAKKVFRKNPKNEVLNDDEVPQPTEADVVKMIKELYEMLGENETVTQALKRLANERRERKQAQEPRKKKKSNVMADANDGFAKPIAPSRQGNEDEFDRLTQLADALLSVGQHSIYSFTRNDLNRALLAKKKKAKIWKYVIRGEDGTDSELYGPFDTDAMNEWQYQGYFNDGNVFVKPLVGPHKCQLRPVDDVDFDEEIEKMN